MPHPGLCRIPVADRWMVADQSISESPQRWRMFCDELADAA